MFSLCFLCYPVSVTRYNSFVVSIAPGAGRNLTLIRLYMKTGRFQSRLC